MSTQQTATDSPVYRLTREERELVISFSEADQTMHLHSTSPTWTRRLLKRGWTGVETAGGGMEFVIPKRALTIRSAKAVSGASLDPEASEDAEEADFSAEPGMGEGFGGKDDSVGEADLVENG